MSDHKESPAGAGQWTVDLGSVQLVRQGREIGYSTPAVDYKTPLCCLLSSLPL